MAFNIAYEDYDENEFEFQVTPKPSMMTTSLEKSICKNFSMLTLPQTAKGDSNENDCHRFPMPATPRNPAGGDSKSCNVENVEEDNEFAIYQELITTEIPEAKDCISLTPKATTQKFTENIETPRNFKNEKTVQNTQNSENLENLEAINLCLKIENEFPIFHLNENVVPPLDIRSECNYPVEPQLTFKLPRKSETAKIVLEPNKHYEAWLAKKREQKLNEAARRKREQAEKIRKEEERKRLAEIKYQLWLQKKEANLKKQNTKNNNKRKSQSTSNSSSSSTSSPSSASSSSSKSKSKSTQAKSITVNDEIEKKRKLQEWERKKRQQEHERRLREFEAEKKRAEEEAERRQRNSGVHEQWLKRNKNAPKPVPLNQGLLTLRGTISKIFVNPNKWRSD